MALPILAEKLEQQSVLKHYDLHVAALRGLVQTGLDGLDDMAAVTGLMRTEGVIQNGEKVALVEGQEAGKRYISVTTTMHNATSRNSSGWRRPPHRTLAPRSKRWIETDIPAYAIAHRPSDWAS